MSVETVDIVYVKGRLDALYQDISVVWTEGEWDQASEERFAQGFLDVLVGALANGWDLTPYLPCPDVEDFFCELLLPIMPREAVISFFSCFKALNRRNSDRSIDNDEDTPAMKYCHLIDFFVYHLEHNVFFRDVIALEHEVKSIDVNGDLEANYCTAVDIERRLLELIEDYVCIDDREKVEPATIVNTELLVDPCIQVNRLGCKYHLVNILGETRFIKNLYSARSELGTVDRVALERERLKYGAKGANLMVMEDFLARLKESRFKDHGFFVNIPPFRLVEVGVYLKWLNGENVEVDLRSIYDEFVSGRDVVVRSSAVYSEDGENVTGAGVYESIVDRGSAGMSFENFMEIVYEVYRSCESEEAQLYRRQNGVSEQELMGLVIQERVNSPTQFNLDSQRVYTQKLIEVTVGDTTVIYDRSKVLRRILNIDVHYEGVGPSGDLYIPADFITRDFKPYYRAYDEGFPFMIMLELYFGGPVQVEFLLNYRTDYSDTSSFVQVRPLPKRLFAAHEIQLPESNDYIAEFRSFGLCDAVYEVIDSRNAFKHEGIVVFNSSEGATIGTLGNVVSSLPKKGVVMMLGRSNTFSGHVETLAVEKGLVVLSPHNGTGLQAIRDEIQRDTLSASNGLREKVKLRVVSNGEIARVYSVK